MARMSGVLFALAAICLILSDVAVGQSSTTSTTVNPSSTTVSSVSSSSASPDLPKTCQDATAASVNGNLLLGTWFEAARKPVTGSSDVEECVQLVIAYNNGQVTIANTYSGTTDLWVNQTTSISLTFNVPDGTTTPDIFPAVFNATYNNLDMTFKIVSTDYNTFALVCGYIQQTGATPTTSSNGAFILTRQREVSPTVLSNLLSTAVESYSDFTNLASVTQTSECYQSGAGTSVPALALVLTLVYGLVKFVH